MLSKLNNMREFREQGFTLIELLVVILIIGILAAIAIPMFLNQRKAAVDSSVQSDVSNAAKQVETWIVTAGATEEAIPAAGSAGAIDQIQVSDGTELTITGSSFHYVIEATNTGGDRANTGDGIIYDSKQGGMLESSVTAAPTPTVGTGITAGIWSS